MRPLWRFVLVCMVAAALPAGVASAEVNVNLEGLAAKHSGDPLLGALFTSQSEMLTDLREYRNNTHGVNKQSERYGRKRFWCKY